MDSAGSTPGALGSAVRWVVRPEARDGGPSFVTHPSGLLTFWFVEVVTRPTFVCTQQKRGTFNVALRPFSLATCLGEGGLCRRGTYG
jgi:hypothetical protein